MNTFTKTWKENQELVRTENGALTYNTSANSNVDLFFKIGALRGQGTERLYKTFAAAFGENPFIATRILLWARDVRGGAGERQIFRDLLVWLEKNNRDVLDLVLPKIPELGRWDDIFVLTSQEFKTKAYTMLESALREGSALAAKWTPRKGPIAVELRKFFNLTPKQYRKVLVKLTNVVETQMCAKMWGSINYEHVPSLAQARYSKAFLRHDETRYREYGSRAAKQEVNPDTGKVTKINAGAVYPYDVLKVATNSYGYQNYDPNIVRAQWDALPNYVGDKRILPVIDMSGSMIASCGGNLRCMDVAISLGLYLATKNTGDFGNMFMTFSDTPELVTLKGNDIISHIQQLNSSGWGYSTNIEAAFARILKHAVNNNVKQEDLPDSILVLSDMEFNQSSFRFNSTVFDNYKMLFKNAGYTAPNVVWWNIQSRQDNIPVKFDDSGTALVSGFSPTIAKNIMSGSGVSPVEMMMNVIMDSRYDLDIAA
jgi:Domain of unknown function (DUF2828)